MAFPEQLINEKLDMLAYGCIVPGCDRHGFDARSLVKHLIILHGPEEEAIYKTELTVMHYDMLRAHAAALKMDARRLKAAVRKSKKNAEDLLVKHCEQLSRKEAEFAVERERYEALLQNKQTYERDAYAMLGRMCF